MVVVIALEAELEVHVELMVDTPISKQRFEKYGSWNERSWKTLELCEFWMDYIPSHVVKKKKLLYVKQTDRQTENETYRQTDREQI